MDFSGVLFCPRYKGVFLQQVQALQRDVEDSQTTNAQLEAHSTEMQQKVYKSSDRQHVCLETTQLVVIQHDLHTNKGTLRNVHCHW